MVTKPETSRKPNRQAGNQFSNRISNRQIDYTSKRLYVNVKGNRMYMLVIMKDVEKGG
jgi:hypothetical protein